MMTRLVAKGYAQKEGIDYNEIFSPVVKRSSIQILLALVAQFDLKLVQLDVKTAFLHGNLSEAIYIRQPEGYEEKGKDSLFYKLNKSLYGLKQSPRQCRPDISHAVGTISRFMHNPGKVYWEAAKWILRYLHGTRETEICFENNSEGVEKFSIGYVDSDFASDLDKRRSTTGYVFTMAKVPICWRSILQPIVALSTTEAEYMAVAKAIREAIWTLGLLEDLGVNQHKLDVYCDSQSAIYLATYQVHHAITKHIVVRYHFVREVIAEDDIRIKKIAMVDNSTNMLTKVVEIVEVWFEIDYVFLAKLGIQ
ncbi:unnamed protein product, partial [Prunus brigantina]